MPGRGLTLLSLDGGGVRGLSSLYILKAIMESVAQEKGKSEPTKPCKYFDMIGGTSTGGLIAIMLGHLEMTINECINTYLSLAELVFSRESVAPIPAGVSPRCGDIKTRFDSDALEKAVKKILRDRGRDEEELFYQKNKAPQCKVFVTAFFAREKSSILLTNYETPRQDSDRIDSVKTWQAVRATFAATSFFEPQTICMGSCSGYTETFTCEGTGINNPVSLVWNEACDVFLAQAERLEDNLDCMLSIGTGEPSKNAFGENFQDIAQTLIAISTETKDLAKEFRRKHILLENEGRYSRFNVIIGLQDVGLEEHAKVYTITTATKTYLKENHTAAQLQKFLALLKQRDYGHNSERALILHRPLRLQASEKISSYDQDRKQREVYSHKAPRTCEWVLESEFFSNWYNDPSSHTLLCVGSIGCGKTILASSIINHLQKLQAQHLSPVVHYYLDSNTLRSSTFVDVVRSFIRQLFSHRRNLHPRTQTQIEDDLQLIFGGQVTTCSDYELENILLELVELFPKIFVIVDGIHEMSHQEDIKRILFALSRVSRIQPSKPYKLLIFSRESLGADIHMERYFDDPKQLHLSLDHLKEDISTFVDYEIAMRQRLQHVTNSKQLLNEIRNTLKSKSEKMFLWIRLQISSIWSSCRNDLEIRQMIDNLPDELEDLYVQCLERVEASAVTTENTLPRGLRYKLGRVTQRQMAINTFRWAVCGLGPLSIHQTRELISLRTDMTELNSSIIANAKPTDFCGNLLEFDFSGRELRCIHSSVKKFLTATDQIPAHLRDYVVSIDVVNEWCGEICLTFMELSMTSQYKAQQHFREVGTQLHKRFRAPMFAQSLWVRSQKLFQSSSENLHNQELIPSHSIMPVTFGSEKWHVSSYIKEYWLPHTNKLKETSAAYSQFVRCVQRSNVYWQPWAIAYSDDATNSRRLLQYAIAYDHCMLLQQALAIIKSRDMRHILNEPLPDGELLPIHHAAFLGHLHVVKALGGSLSTYSRDKGGDTTAIWAARGRQTHVLEFLYQTESNGAMLSYNNEGESVLSIGVDQGDVELVRHSSKWYPHGTTPSLHVQEVFQNAFLARNNKLEIVWILLGMITNLKLADLPGFDRETSMTYDAASSDARLIYCLTVKELFDLSWVRKAVLEDPFIQRQMRRSDFVESDYVRSIVRFGPHITAVEMAFNAVLPFVTHKMVSSIISREHRRDRCLTSREVRFLTISYIGYNSTFRQTSLDYDTRIGILTEIILCLDDRYLMKAFSSHRSSVYLGSHDFQSHLGNILFITSQRPTPYATQWILNDDAFTNINEFHNSRTPLAIAAERGYTEVVFLLLLTIANVSSGAQEAGHRGEFDAKKFYLQEAIRLAQWQGFTMTARLIIIWTQGNLGSYFAKFLKRPEVQLSYLSKEDWPSILQIFEHYCVRFPKSISSLTRWESEMHKLISRPETTCYRFPEDFIWQETHCYGMGRWQQKEWNSTTLAATTATYSASFVLGSDEWWSKVVGSEDA